MFAMGTSIRSERGPGNPALLQIFQNGMTVSNAPRPDRMKMKAMIPNSATPGIPTVSISLSFLSNVIVTIFRKRELSEIWRTNLFDDSRFSIYLVLNTRRYGTAEFPFVSLNALFFWVLIQIA